MGLSFGDTALGGGRSRPRRGAAKRRGEARPQGQAMSKSGWRLCRDFCHVPAEQRRERLSRRAPVEALERTVVEHVVDPTHLLLGDVAERPALGQDLPDDTVAVLVRPPFP